MSLITVNLNLVSPYGADDIVKPASGQVRFTPVAHGKYNGALRTIETIISSIVQGEMAPVELTPGLWTVEVLPVKGNPWPPVTFTLEEGMTEPVNLAELAPEIVIKGEQLAKGDPGPTIASWEDNEDGTIKFLLSDGTYTDSGAMPRGPQGPVGPAGPQGVEGPYGGTEVTDPQVASYVASESDTQVAVDHLVQARHSAITRKLDGTRLLIIGDSISILGTSGVQGQSHTCWYQWESGGRLHEVARTAQSGARSDQQLADVRAYWEAGPADPASLAICQVGTNDLNQDVPMETWLGYVHDIVTVNAQNGCDTVLCTIPPRSGPANPKPPSVVDGEWNAALRDYAYRNGIPVVDIWAALADPATGEFRPGEVDPSDGVHPNYLGMRRMADEVKRALYPLLAEPQELRQPAGITTRVPGEPGGILPTPIFTAPGEPSQLGFASATPADAWEVVWEPSAPGGYAVELDVTDPATRPDLMQRALIGDGGWESGDRILAVARMRIIASQDIPPGNGVRISLTQMPAGTTGYGSFCFGQFLPTAEWQTVRFEFTPDATATELRWYFQYLKPANTPTNYIRARIASMQLYNLTRMGIK